MKALLELNNIKEKALAEFHALEAEYKKALGEMVAVGFIKNPNNGNGANKVAGTRKRFDLAEAQAAITKKPQALKDLAASLGMSDTTLKKGLEANKKMFAITKEDPKNFRSAVMVALA